MKLACAVLSATYMFAAEPRMAWESELGKKVTIRIAADRVTRGCEECAVFFQPLPGKAQTVSAEVMEGQARIQFVRQPDASNGFTAELLVEPVGARKQICRIHFFWDVAPGGYAGVTPGIAGGTPAPKLSVRGVLGTLAKEAAAGMVASRSGELRWSGRVDGEVRIICRETYCKAVVLAGAPVADEVFQFNQPLPNRRVSVSLAGSRGRGGVWVAQQPSGRNNWAAVVRIRDEQAGSSAYEFRLTW